MQVTNQKPVEISPIYTAKINGPYDAPDYVKQTLATPLFNPLVQGQPASITDNGNNIDEDQVTQNIINCCGAVMNMNAETWVKTLMGKCLVYFDPGTVLTVQNLFAIQAAVKAKLPFPAPNVVYTPATDIIPVSKQFLAGQVDYETYFGTMAFYTRCQTLGFYFANSVAFDAFKTWFTTQITPLASGFPAQTNQMIADFNNLNLNELTESLVLRNQDSDNLDEYSFARVLVSYLMMYAKQTSTAEFGCLPFDLGELYLPKTIVFVNVEKHTHATSKQIADEWNIINKSLSMKIKMVSNNKLQKLTATVRSVQKMSSAAASAATNLGMGVSRSANVKFRKNAPNIIDIAKMLKAVADKMALVARSENIYKSVKMTFAKPNRRDPDDFNKQGKSVSTKYRPDIHVYLDTSGSISEKNYQDAIKALIRMAKKMNVNLYFNSFSHHLSQCTKLNTRDKPLAGVYAEFRRVPKVTGGTDYEQIWHYINRSAKRRRELSLIITDFEYTPPNHYVKHPKNLYYLPISKANWKSITRYAEDFVKCMVSNEPAIRKHILF